MRVALLLVFAIWWGGFTFYASIVVPVGSETLGSSRTQGFITQEVTHWLNIAAALTIFLLAMDLWLNRGSRKTRNLLLEVALAIGLSLCLVTLAFLHPQLDELITVSGETISDEAKFYRIHRIYLWVSTVQWVIGAVWMASFLMGFRPQNEILKGNRLNDE